MRFLLVTVMAVGLAGLATTVAWAAIPDSNGRLNACYNNLTKLLVLTDPAGSCSLGFTAIDWDQRSGVKMVENRIQTDSGTSGQQILAVPGFGSFSVVTCDDNYSAANFKFTNTSGVPVDIGIDGGYGGLTAPLEDDGEWAFSTSETTAGPGNMSILLARGLGAASKTASLQIFAVNDFDGNHTGCRFSAQAMLSQ
jgi:hypothetical protein